MPASEGGVLGIHRVACQSGGRSPWMGAEVWGWEGARAAPRSLAVAGMPLGPRDAWHVGLSI